MIDDMTKYGMASGESFDDYFVRLFENKEAYGLSCQDVADLLNQCVGEEYTESKWRKEFASFARGMRYVEQKKMRGVADRILCISDTHVPYQLPIEAYAKYAGVTDTLVINGDVCDCQAISTFPKTYRLSPMQEMIQARAYMTSLITYIMPKRVIINYGNHDIRFQSYFSKNIDTDILELMPKTSLDLIVNDGFNHYNKENDTKTYYGPIKHHFSELGIDVEYTDSWYCQVGKTIFCHPSSYSSGILKTADKACQYFRNEGFVFTSLVMAHTHRVGEYRVGNTTIYEQGCCCDVKKQRYHDGALVNSQKEGFIYLCQDANGELMRNNSMLEELN